jgi:integrase/recombinase XerD
MVSCRLEAGKGDTMKASARVRVSGPLVEFVGGFTDAMTDRGYTDLSLANQLRLMSDLSRWLDLRGVGARELTGDLVEEFLAKRRRTHTQFCTWRALAPLLDHLRSLGVVAAFAPRTPPRRPLLQRYERSSRQSIACWEY